MRLALVEGNFGMRADGDTCTHTSLPAKLRSELYRRASEIHVEMLQNLRSVEMAPVLLLVDGSCSSKSIVSNLQACISQLERVSRYLQQHTTPQTQFSFPQTAGPCCNINLRLAAESRLLK